jgi:hypothetical protein
MRVRRGKGIEWSERSVVWSCRAGGNEHGQAMGREAIELQSDHDLGLCRITKSDHGFTTANVFRPMKASLMMHPGVSQHQMQGRLSKG